MITLQNVYSTPGAKDFLYEMLKERELDADVNISHHTTPTWGSHMEFVDSFPYHVWYLINYKDMTQRSGWAGHVYATPRNEIGVMIRAPFRRMGLASTAIRALIGLHRPLPPIPAVRSGHWLANIHPKNEASVKLFRSIGFAHLQNTYSMAQPREGKNG